MNLPGPWNAGKSRKERETCYEKKILYNLLIFDSPFLFRLKPEFVSLGARTKC